MIVQRTTTYAVCPSCGADAGIVDHLLGMTIQTSWYCDACGQRYHLDFVNGGVEITVALGRKITTVNLLVLRPQNKPVYFVVEGMRFEEGRDNESVEERARYFYEEHSCPTNWLQPNVVYFDGDSDPHGLIEFVATRDDATFPPDEPVGPNDHDEALLEAKIGRFSE